MQLMNKSFRPDAARVGGVGLQIVRDWVLWFNAEGPDGLVNGKAPGAPRLLTPLGQLISANL